MQKKVGINTTSTSAITITINNNNNNNNNNHDRTNFATIGGEASQSGGHQTF